MYTLFIAIGSAFLFIAVAIITVIEEGRGKRLFAAGLRTWLDYAYEQMARAVYHAYRYIIRHIITLSWYYSIHAVLKFVLKSLAGMYTFVENILIRNRNRARELRRERRQSHLTTLAEHRAEVSLTAAQKKKLKDAALKGK